MGSEHIIFIAIASTIAAVIALFFSSELGGDVPDSSDAAISDGGWGIFQFISIQTVLIATMSMSWSWLYWQSKELELVVQIMGTFAFAAAMTYLYIGGVGLIAKLNSTSKLKGFTPEVGMTGVVYVRIPSSNEGHGIVTFMDPVLGDISMDATTVVDMDIENGTRVIVTQVSSDRVVVRPSKAVN